MSQDVITVAIVEDNAGLRRSFEKMLQDVPGVKCLGAFADGEQAVDALPGLRPDVVLMDINLPGMSGVQCVARLAQDMPGMQIIMVTVYDDAEAIFDSLEAGAGGYLLKPIRSADLITAIREIHAGGAPMSASIARRVVQAFKAPSAPRNEEVPLAPREHEILDLLAKGLLQKEIAEQLGISYWTVQTHVARIYEKLHVHSRAQAVARYLRQ